MNHFGNKTFTFGRRGISVWAILAFVCTTILPPDVAALTISKSLELPPVGTMVEMTQGYQPPVVRGMSIDPDNPLNFTFYVSSGDDQMDEAALRATSDKLIKYFLASLTTPSNDLWVNLSPHEKDQIISEKFGVTEMGRDLLAQDYILKQLTASLMYPEDELGQKFWKRVHAKAAEKFGTTQIPMNAYHKIWIVPDRAAVYENAGGAFVVNSRLKVMLAEDYVAMQQAAGRANYAGARTDNSEQNAVVSQIIREVLVPEIEKEVNEGETFASLRQVYHSMILAAWFKNSLKESLLGQVYVDREKVAGVDVDDPQIKEKIYDQYLQAFKKGVYNYIKEEYDPVSQEVLPRQYFSGGAGFQGIDRAVLAETYTPATLRSAPADVIAAVQDVAEDSAVMAVEFALYEADAAGKNAGIIADAFARVQRDAAVLADENFERLTASLAPFDKSYIAGLYQKYAALRESEAKGAEKQGLVIGANFKPSAQLSSLERRELLGARDFATDIFGNEAYAEAAQDVVVIANPMNGGLGSSVSRRSYLERMTGRTELGAKGTDLFFRVEVNGYDADGKRMKVVEQVSVTELKYIQAIRSANKYGQTIIQELVNEDSIGPMNRFLDETIFLTDRVDQRPNAPRRTYRQVIEETEGISLADTMIEQGSLPVIDVATNELTDDYTAPGGHGQLGSMVLQEALTAELVEGKTVIRAVFNGDGPNNMISKSIAGFMARENIPIVMISTTKTPLDKKGGLIGLETMPNGRVRAQMLELAQAKANGQEQIFTAMGLTEGETGAQFFNTNVAAVNYTALQPFLRELRDIIGEEQFNEIVTPDLIPNEKTKTGGRKVIQLEGAMGSALLNINGFVTTTDNEAVQALMEKYGFDRLLTVVNVDEENRTRFFTPIKFAYDHILYAATDHFTVDVASGLLVNKGGSHLPGFATMDDYYKDVQNGINAFEGTSMLGLDELHAVGKTNMPGATLVGRVAVNNRSDKELDLNQFADEIGRTPQGGLLLDNVYVEIDKSGALALVRPITDVDVQARLSGTDAAVLASAPTEADLRNILADAAMQADENFERLTASLAPFDRSYIAGLYEKYVALKQAEVDGAERQGLVIGQNFKPSAQLTAVDRKELLGARDFATDIFGHPEYAEAAKSVTVIANPMNGGLGSSVSRESYLQRMTGRTALGAKGTDLFFKVEVNGFDADGKRMTVVEQVSVTELKYLQAIRSADKFGRTVIQELVNEDSIGPMNRFLDETIFLMDRVDQRPGAQRRTYRQILAETDGVEIAETMIEQGSLPVIDVATNELTDDFTAPGGHGQLGSMVLQEALTAELTEGETVIRAVFNGDGPNNNITKSVAGFMAKENIPIVMISTTKTPLDKKGGLIGLETMPNGTVRAQMLELAQAKANGQEKIFTAMGLTEGEAGAQFFNTNVAAVNYTALQPFLRELKDLIGEAKFNEIVTPDLIPNEKTKAGGRKVIQLEGAMGSALLNLNGFVTTTDNEAVQRLMQKYGFQRLLTIVNVDEENRSRFFTPIKFAYDHILYSATDHFTVDVASGLLVNRGGTHLPGFATMDDYYKDVQNGIDAFDGASMLGLDELHIKGKVNMPGAVLVGEVAINSKVDRVIDLNQFADEIGTTPQGKLQLDNVYVEVDESGALALVRPIGEVDLQARLADSAVLAEVVTDKSILEWSTGRFRQPTEKTPTQTLEQVLGQIIKEYDIRGYDGFGDPDTNPQQYDEELLKWIGRTMATVEFESQVHRGKRVKLEPGDSFVIAGDNGPSTQWVKDNLIAGLREAGINVIDLGGSREGEQTVISGQLYKSIRELGAQGGLYVTRSHVEIGTNGMKPNIGGITLYGDMLTAIRDQILQGEYLQAETPGSLDTSADTRARSREAYYKSLRSEYQGLREAISAAGLKVALNFNGGSSVDYRDIAEELVGAENITRIIRAESDPYNENGGLADPSRDDDTALSHPKENVIAYSKANPNEFIISFDLDTDRVSIVMDGELYLGDRMFYPIVEHLLTLDEYSDIHKTQPIWVDSRMRKEVGILAKFFGGIAKKHPKGHSKVKATMDMQLLELAESKGFETVQDFLDAHPGYKDVQAEYSLHMFKTDQKGQAFDDALDFGLYWLQVYTELMAAHRAQGHEWAQSGRFDAYIDHLVSIGAFQISEQLKEQRTPSSDTGKTKVMIAMKDAIVAALDGREDFAYEDEWRIADSDARIKLVNIDGVFDLTTPQGNIFWGWSNTSPKVAFGVQSDTNADTVALTEAVTALYIHSRNEVDADLPQIDDKETKALRDLLGEESSAAVEARVLAKYPTIKSAIAGLTQTDQAQLVTQKPETTGGIDLNPELLDLQIKRDGNGVPLPTGMQPVESLQNINGFIPVIIQMTPINNLPLLLGVIEDESPRQIGYESEATDNQPQARVDVPVQPAADDVS